MISQLLYRTDIFYDLYMHDHLFSLDCQRKYV